MSFIAGRAIKGLTLTLFNNTKPYQSSRNLATAVMPFIEDQPIQGTRRRSLQSVMMRSGTSKGLFLHRDHLPKNQSDWDPILLSAMGSATGDRRQLDGVGGATSTTSKIAIVGPSAREDADIDYTFAQVAVGEKKIDMTGNCGNMVSGVGPFALDEGLVQAQPGQEEIDIRIYNTNTARSLVSTVRVGPHGKFEEAGSHRISGYTGSGSRIKLNFVEPAGSMTGKLFPSGSRRDRVTVASPGLAATTTVSVTLIDAANPFVFVDSATLPPVYHQLGPEAPASLELIESIRKKGAVLFGLAKDETEAALTRATPKIAVLSTPRINAHVATSYDADAERQPDINVTAYSMGKVHPSLQLTGAVCLGAAMGISSTVASDLSRDGRPPEQRRKAPGKVDLPGVSEKMAGVTGGEVCIGQRAGKMLADVRVNPFGPRVEGVTVDRTAQRIFEGKVMVAAA